MPKANPTAPSAEANAARRNPSGPLGILVIDDEALICGLVSDALTPEVTRYGRRPPPSAGWSS